MNEISARKAARLAMDQLANAMRPLRPNNQQVTDESRRLTMLGLAMAFVGVAAACSNETDSEPASSPTGAAPPAPASPAAAPSSPLPGPGAPATPPPPPTGPAPAPSAAYRNAQPYLFNAIAAASEASRVPGGSALNLNVVGPLRGYVDGAGWSWDNAGGDWIDSTLTRMGGTPWVSMATPAAVAATTYSANVTAALQRVRADNRWNAWILSRTPGSTVRTVAARFHATVAYRPRIEVTYTDASTGTLACRVSASLSGSITIPDQATSTYGLTETPGTGELALEFDLPTKDITSATLYFTVTDHWGGSATLRFNLADPPVNTDPVTSGYSSAYPLDAGITANAATIFSHRYQDGSVIADYVHASTTIDAELASWWSPELVGGAVDTSKLPHLGLGKFIGLGPTASIVSSSYTGENFEPLATGIGAMKVLMNKHPGIVDGFEGGQNGTAAANAHMYLPAAISGLQRNLFVRYYMRIGARHVSPYRFRLTEDKLHVLKAGVPIWTDGGGKCSIGFAHKTKTGGNSGTAGGGWGWTMRQEFGDYHHSPDSPSAGGWNRSWSWYDFQAHNPPGHNYGGGDLLAKKDHSLSQRGGLGAMMYADRWYCIEEEINLNSVDTLNAADGRYWSPDGVLRCWIDGRLAYERSGVVFRSLPPVAQPAGYQPGVRELGVSSMWFNWFHGGLTRNTVDRAVFISGLVVGTSRIGPMRK